MAKVVIGIGTSHSPQVSLAGEQWLEQGDFDRKRTTLNPADGRSISYDVLSRETGDRYADVAVLDTFKQQEAAVQRALDRIADDLEAAAPDVVVIIGDDHYELFAPSNMPAFAIYLGEDVLTIGKRITDKTPAWRVQGWKAQGVDKVNNYPGHPALARDLTERLIERGIDVGTSTKVEDPNKLGFGHAYGFVVERFFKGRRIPMVPILLNTYFKPNAPTPKRCYEIGTAIRAAIEECPLDLRVAVVASGGLSHHIVEEEMDRGIIAALKARDAEALTSLPTRALNEGSSEIRCWIMAAPLFEALDNKWLDYIPARRTAAGTGVGLAFGTWT